MPEATPTKRIVVSTDGASRGNPGPAAVGAVIYNGHGLVYERISRCIGITTNNQAEYQAVLAGLTAALKLKPDELVLRMDSELVAKQLRGEYKVRHPDLKPLYDQAKVLLDQFPRVTVTHTRREGNRVADGLANEALDAQRRP